MGPARKQGERSLCSPRHNTDPSVMNIYVRGYLSNYWECIAEGGSFFEWTGGKKHAFLKQKLDTRKKI
jgi:hypothetical protein